MIVEQVRNQLLWLHIHTRTHLYIFVYICTYVCLDTNKYAFKTRLQGCDCCMPLRSIYTYVCTYEYILLWESATYLYILQYVCELVQIFTYSYTRPLKGTIGPRILNGLKFSCRILRKTPYIRMYVCVYIQKYAHKGSYASRSFGCVLCFTAMRSHVK